MSGDHQAAVLAALAGFPGYRAPTMWTLGRASGVQGEALFSALRALRDEGAVEWDVLRLSARTRAELDAQSATEAPRSDAALAAQRQARLVDAVQGLALADDPTQAAAMLRRQWQPLWQRLCAQARETGQRPVELLVRLVEQGL